MTSLLAVAITIALLMAPTSASAEELQLDENRTYIIIGLSDRTLTTYIPMICEKTPIKCPADDRNGRIRNIIDGLVFYMTLGLHDSIKTFGGTVEVIP